MGHPLTGKLIAALVVAAISTTPLAAQPEATVPPEQPAGPIPLTDFAALPFLSEPLLSPDGTRIAARVSGQGTEEIRVWTLDENRDRDPIRVPASGNERFQWAGNNRLLITISVSFDLFIGGALLHVRFQRVQSYDLQNRKLIPLGQNAGFLQDVIFIDPDGRYILLSDQERMDRSPNVVRIDLETGASTEVQAARRGVWSWFADAEGVVRVGVDYGERRTRIYYRAEAQAPLTLVETRRNLADDSIIDAVRFVTNTSRGIIVTNAETGRFAIYEYDFATDSRGALLFAHPNVDVTRGVFGPEGGLQGVVYEDDRPRVQWFDSQLAEVQRRIDRTFPDHTNVIVNASRNGNRLLIFSTAADDPGTYYVFDQASRRMEIFASPYDRLVGRSFAPVRPISYQSRDGLAINGYLTLPPGANQRNLPLIVLPHGGPFLRDSWSFNPEVQFLASRGYAVLQPNFRGSTGYGREFVERGYGQFGAGMIFDMDDGVDWLIREGIADARRVCVMGTSYGGYAAIWSAMRSPERYRCAISLAGPTDLRRMIQQDSRFFLARRYTREMRLRLQGEERVDLDAISPARNAEMLRVPLLLGHGEPDRVVPIDQSQRLVRALERAGTPNVETVMYRKSGHGFTDAAESADWLRRVEAFLARHNPAGPLSEPPSTGSATALR
jgi:dipeptidyl aminopeptidase/acylaminoacyl peptidase